VFIIGIVFFVGVIAPPPPPERQNILNKKIPAKQRISKYWD
jgi:hypothetical protein